MKTCSSCFCSSLSFGTPLEFPHFLQHMQQCCSNSYSPTELATQQITRVVDFHGLATHVVYSGACNDAMLIENIQPCLPVDGIPTAATQHNVTSLRNKNISY